MYSFIASPRVANFVTPTLGCHSWLVRTSPYWASTHYRRTDSTAGTPRDSGCVSGRSEPSLRIGRNCKEQLRKPWIIVDVNTYLYGITMGACIRATGMRESRDSRHGIDLESS